MELQKENSSHKIFVSDMLPTLAAGLYVFILMFLPFISLLSTAFFLIYLNNIGRIILCLYLTYIYLHNKKILSSVNSNGLLFWLTNFMTKHHRDYFPIELVKTAELTPDRNYLVASFPHGILGTGAVNNMGCNITKWLELFPNIRPKIATMDMYFYVPIMREIILSWGFVSCSKESILNHLMPSHDNKHILGHKDEFTSNAVGLLVGGCQEAFDARPGQYVLTLKNRKGFVKIAIQSGSPIVPSFSFGEVDIFDQMPNPPDSLLRKFQIFVKQLIGVYPLIVLGRSSFFPLPQRRPIVQVVGSPIEVRQMNEPDMAYVNEIHQKVIDSLNEMFEKYKHKYIENSDKTHLVIN